jgi:multisubunit Na+/H+ antiporter MnhC subunit
MYREKHGRNMLLILLVLAIATAVSAQVRQVSLSTQAAETTLINNSDLGFEVAYRVSGLSIREVNTREGAFDELTIEGYTHTTDIGMPKLPMQRKLIAVPLGASVNFTILSKTERELDQASNRLEHRVLPAQEPVSKSADPATLPFVVKNEAYSRNGYDTRDMIQVSELGFMRGVRMFALDFFPVGYNPVENTLRVIENLEIRIDFVNPDLIATADLLAKTGSVEFDQLYAQSLFNWNADTRTSIVRYPTKMLILCPPNYTDEMQSFVDWKKQQGYNVIVTTVGTGGTVANTTSAINTYMAGVWSAATAQDPAPTYLLIVGDTSTSGDNIIANTGATASHVTDLTYVRLQGTDYVPEMYYGRFSVSSAAELTNIINKTITFEKTQMSDLSYLGKAVMIAGQDATFGPTHGDGAINYGTQNYFNTSHGITSNTYLHAVSGSSDAAIIANANEGRGYMNYTAHGSQTSWADPTFSVSDVNAMTNNGKYGVMVGNCCVTNAFDTGVCFGESIIRKANAGGVAYIGGTNNTYWDEDYWWAVGAKGTANGTAPAYDATKLGVYDAMFHTHSETQTDWAQTTGDVIWMGNLAVAQGNSSRTNYYWEIYSIMGDPSLMPYFGTPTVNTATFPSTILIGATSINVTAAPYSRVTLSMGGTLYGTAIVPAGGSLTLPITPFTSTGTATLVITAQNKITRIESISIAPNSGPYINVAATNYNDSNNSIPEYNETGRFSPNFENVGTVAVTNATATLTCATAGITITDATESIASLAAGANVTKTNAFSFNIANNVANGTVANFTITTTMSGQSPWVHNFTLTLNAPTLAFGNMTVSDPTGNNNGRLDPGESVTITMPLANSGAAASPAGNATLTCATPGITINTGTASFASIAASGSTNLSFGLTAASGMTIGTVANLVFSATAGAYTANKTENTAVGLILEDFETGNFSSYPWIMGGTSPWTVVNTGAHAGTYTAKSGVITHSQSSTMETTRILSAPGDLSFWYKVSSESGYDFLKFYVDGVQQNQWSGTVDWTQYTINLAAGTRILKWEYMKDGSVDSGSNCAWVDDIIFPASTTPSNFYPPQNLSATPGNGFVNLAWQAPVSGTPTGYRIYRQSSLLTTVTALTYTDNAVVNETTYSYYVVAVYSGGVSDPSNTVQATPTAVVVTEVIIGTGTTSTGTTTACPVNQYYRSLHGQSVYTAAELNAAGVVGPINITQVGFNITGLPAQAMPNFLVRMGHTTAANAAAWTPVANLTQVWSSASYLPTVTGWNMYTLSTPFQWNGTDNIVIDTAFGQIASYQQSGTTMYSTVTSGYIYNRSDSADQSNSFTGGSTSTNRPNVKFALQPNTSGPTIAVNPGTLAYGDVAVGGNSVQTFTIQNGGDQTLTGSISTPTGYSVALAARSSEPMLSGNKDSRNTLPFSVNAGASKTYNLTFAPTAASAYNGNVVINSNAVNTTTFNLSVTGAGFVPPTIDVSTGELYSSLQPGAEGTDSFIITNTGSQALNFSISMEELRNALRGSQLSSSNSGRSIAGSTLTLDAASYLPGTTVDWTFTATNASTDTEWLKDVIITFPAGVTVNSATNFVGGDGGDMTPDVTSGNGVTITWHGEGSSGWGVIYGNGDSATATVNVTIGSSVGGNMNLAYTLVGDIYGADPHTLSDAIVLPQDVPPIEWLSVLPLSGIIPAGQNTVVTVYFSAVGMAPGTYDAMLYVHSNDPVSPTLEVSATMDVTGTVNHAPTLALPNALNFDKNGSLVVDFNPYASDPDLDPLTLSYSGNSNVLVAINGLQVTFTAAQNWTGSENISFTVSDASLTASDVITIYVDPVITPDWTPVVYPNNPATVYGIVTINSIPCNLNDVVAVFVGSECRGVAEVTTNAGNAYVTLLANLAADGETIGLKVWDYETQTTYPVLETYQVSFGQVLGGTTPVPINGVEFIGPISAIDPLSLAFGEVESGTSAVLQFAVTNSGDQTLTGTITTPAGYSVALTAGRYEDMPTAQSSTKTQRNALPYSVAPGTSSNFNVTFAPTAVQAYNGSITVSSNDPAALQTLISVTGSGFTYPSAAVDHDQIVAEVAYGVDTEDSFTLSNSGSRTLTYAIEIDPPVLWLTVNPVSGSVSSTPQTIIASFEASELNPGIYQTTIGISTNAPDNPSIQVPVTLTVLNNVPEIALPETCSFYMDETLPMDFSAYVSDANSQPLTLGYAGNTNVLVQIDGLNVTFSCVPDWYGTETITFSVFDGMDYAYDSMDVTVQIVIPEPPVLDPITEVSPDTGVGLTWQPVQYATEYQIFRSLEGPDTGFVLIGTSSTPNFTDDMLSDKAFYMIKAVNNPITKGGSK